MRTKHIGILNTFLCLTLLVFILTLIQMNRSFHEGIDSSSSDNKGVYFFNSFTCTDFNLTQDGGFECNEIKSSDTGSSSESNPLGTDVGGVYYFKSFSCDDYTISQDGGLTCNKIIMDNSPATTGSS